MRMDEAEMNAANLAMLVDPRGLGRVNVLVLARGLEAMEVPGLHAPGAPRFTVEDLPRIRPPDPFAGLY